jgi:hypothetical protein
VDTAQGQMSIIRQASAFVCRHGWIAIALFAWAYGLRTSGEAEFRTISAAPFVMNLPPQDQYLYSSPFTFFLGSYYQHHGLDYAWAFFVVNALGLAAFFVSLYRLLATDGFGDRSAAALVLFTSPLLFVMLSWIGKSDAYLLAFFFMFTLTESRVSHMVLSALMILCHAEMGAGVLCVDWCLTRRRGAAMAIGLIAGEAAVYAYTHFMLSPMPASRATYALDHLPALWSIFWSHPILHIAATLGPFWIYGATRLFTNPLRAALFALALALAVMSYDFTRIFVIVSAPMLLQITREVVADNARDGGVRVGPWRIGVCALWPIMFLQFQCAGVRLLFAQGVRVALRG